MKTIGKTNEGKILVEMTIEEHQVLGYLAGALEGGGDGIESVLYPKNLDGDISTALGAILGFARTTRILNELENYLAKMRGSMKNSFTYLKTLETEPASNETPS